MLSVFSVLAALLSCGDLVRQSGIVSLPPDSAPTSTSSTTTRTTPSIATRASPSAETASLAALLASNSLTFFYFGARWQYTLQSEVVQISQCALVFDGPANFHCSPVNETHATVVFHPIVVGFLQAKLVLPNREIRLEGVGLPNPFRPSGLNFELPPDVAFEPWLYLHNPLSTPVRLKEVYTSNPLFSVEVPSGISWNIPAHSTRPVARVSLGQDRRYDISYLRVRSVNDEVSLYLPLRLLPPNLVEPTPNGLFYPERNLDIGPVFVTNDPTTVPLNVVNTSPKSVVVQGSGDGDGLRLVAPEKPVGPGKTCTVKVTVDPQRLSRTGGNLLLRGGKLKLQVPYTIQLLNGSLQAANSRFYIGAKGQRAFSVEVKNQVNSGLRIERILVGSQKVDPPTAPVVAKNATVQIDLPPPAYSSRSFNSTMRVLTNVTEFVYDLEFYSGRLDLMIDNKLVTDRVDIGPLGVKQKKKLTLDFYNANPLRMQVEYFASNLSSALIALPSPPPWVLVPYGSLQVMLTVSSPTEGQVWGDITVRTNYQLQSWLFGFQASKGTVTAAGMSSSRMISVEGAFPFRNSAELVYLESTFDEPLMVTEARVNDERFHMVLVDSPVLHPGAKSLLGTLKYRPVCTQCYVGLGGPLESSATKDLFLWREMQERLKEAKAVNTTLLVDTQQMKGFVVPVTVTHVWPRVVARGAVRFDTIQLGNASHHPVIVDNPSDQPLMIQAYISTIGGPEINAIVGAQHSLKLPPHLSTAFSMEGFVPYSLSVIPPKSKKRIMVRFEPTTIGSHIGVLVVRNNLTAVSSLILKGEGGVGKLLLAGHEPGGTIVFDINALLLKDCAHMGVYTSVKKYPVAKNVGHLPIRVRKVLINNQPCVGYGFKIKDCDVNGSGFLIKPNASHRIELNFTPDFTVSRVEVTFSLVLDDSTLDFSVVVTLPKNLVPACAMQQPRPAWEGLFYALCLIGSLMMVLCTVGFAFLEAHRVLQETLCEARSRYERREISLIRRFIQMMTNFMSCSVADLSEEERVDHQATVATQTGMEEAGRERKSSAHKDCRGPSTVRRRDSSASTNVSNGGAGRKDTRRRKKDVSVDAFCDRQHQEPTEATQFFESRPEIGEVDENEIDKASEPEERDGSNAASLIDDDEATNTKETDYFPNADDGGDVEQDIETASEDSSEFSTETPLPSIAGKAKGDVKSKSQRRAEKKERLRKSCQESSTNSTASPTLANDSKTGDTTARPLLNGGVNGQKKNSVTESSISQSDQKRDSRNRKTEVRDCPSRTKKQQKQMVQQQTLVTPSPNRTNIISNGSAGGGSGGNVPATAAGKNSNAKATFAAAVSNPIANDASLNSKTLKNNSKNSTPNGHCATGAALNANGHLKSPPNQPAAATSHKTKTSSPLESGSPVTGKSANLTSSKVGKITPPTGQSKVASTKSSPNAASGTPRNSESSTLSFQSAFHWPSFNSSSASSAAGDSSKSFGDDTNHAPACSNTSVAFPMAWTKPIYSFSSAVISSAASRVTTSLTSGSSSDSRCSPVQDVHPFRGATTAVTRLTNTSSTVSSAQASDVESESNSPKPDEQQEYEEEDTLKLDGKLYIEDNDVSGRNILGETRDELTVLNNAETSDLSRSNSSAGHSSVSNVSCRSIASSSPSSDVIVANSDAVSTAGVSSAGGGASNDDCGAFGGGFGPGRNLAANSIISSMKNSNLILNSMGGGIDASNSVSNTGGQNFGDPSFSMCNSILNNLSTTGNENNSNNNNFGSNTFLNNSYNPPNSPTDTHSAVSQQQQSRTAMGSVNILTDLSTLASGDKFNSNDGSSHALAMKDIGGNILTNNINKNTDSDKSLKQSQQPSKMGVISDICSGTSSTTPTTNITYSAVVSGGINNHSAKNHDTKSNVTSVIAKSSSVSLSNSKNSNHHINSGITGINNISNSNNNKTIKNSVNDVGRSKNHYGVARRGNPPPGFNPRPYDPNANAPTPNSAVYNMGGYGGSMGGGDMSFNRLQSVQSSGASAAAPPSATLTTLSSKSTGIGTDQSEEQEMAPLIRSIIDSVIPSSDRDDRSSVHWGTSNQNSTSNPSGNASQNSGSSASTCQLWGAESSWMSSPGSSAAVAAAAPPSKVYPVFLRRTPDRDPERERLEFEQQQRLAWNQQQPSQHQQQQKQPQHQPGQPQPVPQPHHLHPSAHLNPPAMSPTNDYSYTGTDIWTSTQSGSAEPPVFPSPIGTPWTPFRSPGLTLSSFRGLGLDRGTKKKNS